MKSESFLKGTVILISANALSKILGAILKIPLTYILGEQGMAIYQTSFLVYIMFLSLLTSGLPFALSRYISQEHTLKRYGNIRFSVKLSLSAMAVTGLLGSLIMFFGADFFACAMRDPKSAFAVKAISPSVFFVAIGCVYKGCYQGYACQTPTAISQVIEAFIKLVAGFFLASVFSAFSVKYASGAAIFGVTIGEAVATLVLFLFYVPNQKALRFEKRTHARKKIAISIFSVMLPMTACAVVSSLLGLWDTSVIRSQLANIQFSPSDAVTFSSQYSPYTHLFDKISGGRLSLDGARWLFGAYSGYAMTVFNLPSGILASFGIAILPVVCSAIASNNKKRLVKTISSAAKTVLLIALPCAVIMCVFSKEILYILFKNTASHRMLSLMAPALIFSSLAQFLCSVLHASGNIMSPFRYMTVCNLIKIGLTFVLVPVPRLNILGAIMASFLANVLYFILIFSKIKKDFGIYALSFGNLWKISASALLMIITSLLIISPATNILKNTCSGFFLAILLALTVYALSLLLFGVIKKEEITLFRR